MNKTIVTLILILLLAAAVAAWFRLRRQHRVAGPVLHVRHEFEFTVQAPYNVAAPLFGPEGERAWASDDWNPQFLHPLPSRDTEGAVFQIRRGHGTSTWINTAFDLQHGHIEYVYFLPELMATRIDLHLTQPNSQTTAVHVAYERTALKPSANEKVREFGDHDQASGPEWGADIERYLATHRAAQTHR